jgi:phage/plasmid-like protein (TIGR03299 family)
MSHNIDTMAYYGEKPWHRLGVKIAERADAETMIKAAGIDWIVEKKPADGIRKDVYGNPMKYQIIRKARHERERDIQLALVSGLYTPLQNTEAFQFFDPIIGKKAAIFETAGALGDGERVWALAKLPDSIRVIGDDIVDKYLLLSNNHDGRGAVTIKFTPIRVVCQNTLSLALKDGNAAVRVRHTTSMHERLAEVPKIMGIVNDTYKTMEETFRMIAAVSINTERLLSYLDSVYPQRDAQHEKRTWPRTWESVMELFETGNDNVPDIRGTLWHLYNAITQYEDYRQARDDTRDKRLQRIWFGRGADIKMRAFQQATQFAQQWGNGSPTASLN